MSDVVNKINKIDYSNILSGLYKIIARYKIEIALFVILAISVSIFRIYRRMEYQSQTTLMLVSSARNYNLNSIFRGNMALESLIKSRTLAERVVKKLDLLPIIFEKQWDKNKRIWKKQGLFFKKPFIPTIEKGAMRLRGKVQVSKKEKGRNFMADNSTINITIKDKDPILAVQLIKTYTEELINLINEVDTTNIRKKAQFLKTQLENLKKEIDDLYFYFIIFSERRDVIKISDYLFHILNVSSEKVKEVNFLKVLKEIDIYKNNPQLSEYIKNRINKVERDFDKSIDDYNVSSESDLLVPLSKMPLLEIEYKKIELEYNIKKSFSESLQREYELAKIEQNRIEVPFVVLDKPIEMQESFSTQSFRNLYYQTKYNLKKYLWWLLIYIVIREVLRGRREAKRVVQLKH